MVNFYATVKYLIFEVMHPVIIFNWSSRKLFPEHDDNLRSILNTFLEITLILCTYLECKQTTLRPFAKSYLFLKCHFNSVKIRNNSSKSSPICAFFNCGFQTKSVQSQIFFVQEHSRRPGPRFLLILFSIISWRNRIYQDRSFFFIISSSSCSSFTRRNTLTF